MNIKDSSIKINAIWTHWEFFIPLLGLLLFLWSSWLCKILWHQISKLKCRPGINIFLQPSPRSLPSSMHFYLIMANSNSTLLSVSLSDKRYHYYKDLFLLQGNVNVVISLVHNINWGRQQKGKTSLSCCLPEHIIKLRFLFLCFRVMREDKRLEFLEHCLLWESFPS